MSEVQQRQWSRFGYVQVEVNEDQTQILHLSYYRPDQTLVGVVEQDKIDALLQTLAETDPTPELWKWWHRFAELRGFRECAKASCRPTGQLKKRNTSCKHTR